MKSLLNKLLSGSLNGSFNRSLNGLSLLLCIQLSQAWALPMQDQPPTESPTYQAEPSPEGIDAEMLKLVRQLADSGIDLSGSATDDVPHSSQDARKSSPLYPKKPVKQMDPLEMLEYQDQLKMYLSHLEKKEQAAREAGPPERTGQRAG